MAHAHPVRYERTERVAIVVIDQPPLNLFTHELEIALVDAVAQARDERPGALVIRADGRHFSAGVDVHRFLNIEPEQATTVFPFDALIHEIETLPFPTLALANGLCLTAGMEVCLACDLLWASRSAKFGLVEHRFALTPALGGTQRIAQRAGVARAKELVMTGDTFAAETLERWNVVNRVLDDDTLVPEGLAYAERLAAQPAAAVAATKELLARFVDGGIKAADDAVEVIATPLFASAETRTRTKAFLERQNNG